MVKNSLTLHDRYFAKALGRTPTEAISLQVFARLHEEWPEEVLKYTFCKAVIVLS
jgi:hypothetical protein